MGKYQEMHLEMYNHIILDLERVQAPGRMSKWGQRDCML